MVAVGGACGAAARYGIVAATTSATATLAVNAVGAFLLGLLAERLVRDGDGDGVGDGVGTAHHRRARLFLGTGVLGGFTTYSGVAVEVLGLATHGRWLTAVGYGTATVVTGLVACLLGVVIGARRSPT